MKKSAQHTNGFTPIAVVLVVVGLIVVVAYLMMNGNFSGTSINEGSTLPPVSERINPAPTSGNSIFVEEVDPGNSVLVSEVTLSSDGYIVVMKDNEGIKTEVGQSDLLVAGTHQNVNIETQNLQDGDVIYIMIVDKGGNEVMDENENVIEVQKNVGMVMSHYGDEY